MLRCSRFFKRYKDIIHCFPTTQSVPSYCAISHSISSVHYFMLVVQKPLPRELLHLAPFYHGIIVRFVEKLLRSLIRSILHSSYCWNDYQSRSVGRCQTGNRWHTSPAFSSDHDGEGQQLWRADDKTCLEWWHATGNTSSGEWCSTVVHQLFLLCSRPVVLPFNHRVVFSN